MACGILPAMSDTEKTPDPGEETAAIPAVPPADAPKEDAAAPSAPNPTGS
jgi:hypothetical protein